MPTHETAILTAVTGKISPRFETLPPLALYIHIPWCTRKCPYCDFNSHELQQDSLPEATYLEALITDLEQDLPLVWGRPVETVFIGGGTPSLLSPDGIDWLLSQLRARLPLKPDMEITLEANPGTIEAQRFKEFYDAGINRLSIGVQSFDDDTLFQLGRIHTGEQAQQAMVKAREAGFESINLDLMFGLPGQSTEAAMQDLSTALALQPDHLSYYQLTIEPGTPFHHHPPPRPDDDHIALIQTQGQQLLAAHGYIQYEVSAYARTGHRCRHNLNYWRFGDYLGIGAGAHGKLTDPHTHAIVRMSKIRSPFRYLENVGTPACIQRHHRLQAEEIVLEFLMNALRLNEGFDSRLFTERTGLPLYIVGKSLDKAEADGLLERNDLRIRPTNLGRRYLNNLLEYFVIS